MVGRDTFSPLAPDLGPPKNWLSPSSAVHGGQYDTKYGIRVDIASGIRGFDTIWGVQLEPALMLDAFPLLGKYDT